MNYALKRGWLSRPLYCEECGLDGLPVQGHHEFGYNACFALCVRWLCPGCHRDAHGATRVGQQGFWWDRPELMARGVEKLRNDPQLLENTKLALAEAL